MAFNPTYVPSQSPPAAPSAFWECPKCGFVNQTTNPACKACGGPMSVTAPVAGGGGGVPVPAPYQPQQSMQPMSYPYAQSPSASVAQPQRPYAQVYSAPVLGAQQPANAAARPSPAAYSTPVLTPNQPQTFIPTVQGSFTGSGSGAGTANAVGEARTSINGAGALPSMYANTTASNGGAYQSSGYQSAPPPAAGHHDSSTYNGKDAKYRKDFDRIDKDHSGFIDRQDIKKMLKGTISDSQIDKVLKVADKDKDGRVSFEEYKKMMKKVELAQKLVGKKFLK